MPRTLFAICAILAGCTGAQPPTLPDGKNRVVDIVNTTAVPLHFYAINAERHGLRHPILFAREMAAGSYTTINFADGSGACRFHLHAVLASGAEVVASGFDTCAAASWVVGP
jgi:hypothetical protein